MKLDEILNSQKASAPVASTPMPVTQKTGTLRLSDILSQEPSAPSEIAPVVPKVRTVTNDDNTIKEGVNIAPTFTKTQKAKMGANLAYNAFTEGMWGLPEAMVRSVPSLAEGLTKLSKYTDPNYYLGKVTGSKVAEETNRKNLEQAQKFTKLVKENTGFLDEWKQLGEEYRKAEDAGVPEEFRNSLTGKVSSGVGSSASFLTTLLATRGLGMGAQYAGAGTKIGETLAILANTSQKLGIPLNTLAESQQIKEDTKQELLDMGKDEKEAERLATNVFGVSVVATPALDAIGLFNPAIKKTLVKKMAQFGLDIGSEISQELTQTGAQNVATDKEFFANAKETTTVAGITSAIFSLLTKGHLSLKGEQAQPTVTEPVVQADGTITPPPEGTATPTVGDIIANGQENYTQEEKVTAINNADFENNLVDPTNEVEAGTQEYEDLKSDIKSAIDEGANIGEVIIKLREAYTVSQEYAENIVAEVIATPEATAVVEEVVKPKATPKKVVTTTDLKAGTKFENVGTLKSITQPKLKGKKKGKKKGSVKYYFEHADGVQKYYTEKQALELVRKGYKPAKPRVERAVPQVVDKAKQYGFDNVQYYFDNTDAPETVSYYDNNEKDYVGYRTSTAMADFPEHLRDRKLLNEVEESWYKQTRPEDTGTQASKNRQELYDYLAKQVDNFATDYNKKVDEQMAKDAKGDGAEFKTRKATASREMAVLDDFKKRYKVQFPTLIVDKIIQGKKTKLHPKGDGTAEGATDGNTIAIAFDAVANTGKHEIVHLTLNNLDQIPELAQFLREDILKAQAKKMGVVYDAKKEEKDSLIEEQLALDIELYENKQYKPNNTILAKFFASISKMLKDFRGLIVKSNGDVITQYYDAVLYGETARKQEVAIKTESDVAKYLIDNVLDYTPMYTTRRVLSLSNGITSVDFKTRKEVDPLLEEASKYSSAEEFVKVQGETLYSGSKAKFEQFDFTKADKGGLYGNSVYMTPDAKRALTYGENVTEYVVPKNAKLLKESDFESRVRSITPSVPYGDITVARAKAVEQFIKEGYDGVKTKETTAIFNPKALQTKTQLTELWNKAQETKSQPKFKDALDKSVELYKESGDLTTKILKDLEGKTTVSKQYILDATNRGDVKQIEKDIIRDMLFFEGDKINVKDFAFKVQQELLPLYVKSSDNIIPNEDQDYNPFTMNNEGGFTPKWEFVNLPTDLRGDVEGYVENIYESPIPTVAGKHHYNYLTNNYFGHTRAEDVPNNVRRVIEVQSDLYQKGRLEDEVYNPLRENSPQDFLTDAEYKRYEDYRDIGRRNLPQEKVDDFMALEDKIKAGRSSRNDARNQELSKLQQYNDPTAHFRMIREEIRSATLDGKDVLQFPTGETAMKIEGLSEKSTFKIEDKVLNEETDGSATMSEYEDATPQNIKVGTEIFDRNRTNWVITDVLGDGKFKAIQKSLYDIRGSNWDITINRDGEKPVVEARNRVTGEIDFQEFSPENETRAVDFMKSKVGADKADTTFEEYSNRYAETFDISGKVDTNNPIYKFYEKEVGRYLKNNYKAETVTDDKGVTWYEVKLKDEYKGAVVAFKERVTPEENREEARRMFPRFTKAMEEKKKAQLVIPKKAELGIRSVAKRVEERAKTLGVTVEESYEIKRFVTEVATSEVILDNNKEKIEDILNGSFPYPTEVSKTAFLHTIIEDAKARNDTKTLTKAYNRLAEEATTAGQDIAFINSVYKMYDETSPETYLNKIKAERETVDMQKTWSIKNPFAGKAERERIVRKKTERQKAIRLGVKERTTIKIQELESILDSFVC